MPRWSRQQDDVLWEHGHEGAERCAAIIRHRFGVSRTPDAVKRHAYRIGAPMLKYEICPRCGGAVAYLSRDGICYACRQRDNAERERRKVDALKAQLRDAESPGARRKAEREYDAARTQASRLRRKLRLSADGD